MADAATTLALPASIAQALEPGATTVNSLL